MPQAHVLVLGDKGCGKRSLIKQINKPFQKYLPNNKLEDYASDFANFDSSYMFYKDLHEQSGYDEVNVQTRINVWLISDEEMGKMIPKIIKPKDLQHTFAVIIPDIEQPWEIMNQCEKWIKVLKDAIYQITPNLELRQLDKLKERIEQCYKSYSEPEFDKDGKFIRKQKI